jgi:DNA-binding NarL/FixJ family response regulator
MRILIVDDHPLFRDGLRSLLEARGIEVVGEASDGRSAVELAHRLRPDIVLMDLAMPNLDGLAATRLISASLPDVRVVVLTASDDEADLFEAIKSGAQGYLLKNLESHRFFQLLEGVAQGEPALTSSLARKLLAEFARPHSAAHENRTPNTLTEREQEVLRLLIRGVTSNRELAETLHVSENTVKYHLRNILDKLHLQNRAQVVSYALRHNLLTAR